MGAKIAVRATDHIGRVEVALDLGHRADGGGHRGLDHAGVRLGPGRFGRVGGEHRGGGREVRVRRHPGRA
ncbi:MAG TPA: hypothetical protein VN767_12170 [Streptosporangiaceae bacterium]|nr:hypothetical protein [Streptosporangiaceae bacterium]